MGMESLQYSKAAEVTETLENVGEILMLPWGRGEGGLLNPFLLFIFVTHPDLPVMGCCIAALLV